MGAVLPFPIDYKPAALREQPADVLILPVLRIERHDGGKSRRSQRRRSAQQERLAREIAAWEASACLQG